MALLDRANEPDPERSADKDGDSDRQSAIERVDAKRHFRVEAAIAAIGTVVLVVIWALAEYHNAGGWPTQGFSQSSGIHHVWNYWIVYPLLGIALVLGGRAWFVFGNRPPSESEIKREMERQRAPHGDVHRRKRDTA